jgi:hypothetical protein
MHKQLDDDYEIDAIEKCSRALNKLDDKTKIRVIRFLLDKFGLIAQTENQSKEVVSQNIQYQQNNLVLVEPKEQSQVISGVRDFIPPSNGTLQLKDVLIKGLTNSEPEILLILNFIISNFGTQTFTRQMILDTYRDQKIFTDQRRKSLTLNINSLIKKLLITSITDEEFSLTEKGIENAQNILNGNSTSKKRKPTLKKPKTTKLTEIETEDIVDDNE